ncbi:MAG: 30S ribosomal protein S8 [Candidatus Pacebacteria bacterium]|nr:30S ribosomal protein S8 [Candidatus Paceibacterota bacterium]
MKDSIAELITKLKNANVSGKETVSFPYSKMREQILNTLEKRGFVKAVGKKGKKVNKALEAALVYEDGKSRIQGVSQISKFSKRIYYKVSDIKPVRNGFGALIITTPQGIMTDLEARKAKVGGEPLFKIW